MTERESQTPPPSKPVRATGPFTTIAADASSGVVVFLVALPLCLGIALASGAPLFSGIIAGVIGGLIVSLVSGSAVSVSGPAAGLVVIVASSIESLGSFPAFLLAVVVAGVLQILLGGLGAGRVANYVPNAVIKGMLAAIGVVIILKQIPHALGRDTAYEGDFDFFRAANGSSTTLSDIVTAVGSARAEAIIITILSLAILIFWETSWVKRRKVLSAMPAALIVVVLGIGLNEAFRLFLNGFYLSAADGHLVAPPAGGASDFLAALTSPDWSRWNDQAIYVAGAGIALVASIESLLTLEASDKLDPQRRISSPDRELIAQGVGNVAAGLIGGIPLTAVIVRSSTNVYAGAKTRLSAFFHGVLLLVCVLAIPRLLNLIPLASLAAVLLVVGYRLTKPAIYREIYAAGLDQFLPFMITVLAIVFTDLLTGVLVGIVFGIVIVMRTNHHAAFTLVHQEKLYLLRLNKDASFVNKTELKRKLSSLPDDASLIVDGTGAAFVDADIYDVLADFEAGAVHKQIDIEYKNFHQKLQNYRKWRA